MERRLGCFSAKWRLNPGIATRNRIRNCPQIDPARPTATKEDVVDTMNRIYRIRLGPGRYRSVLSESCSSCSSCQFLSENE
jgi:hypothetical protein